ncbi:MAG: hypothetical protein HUU37_02920, partial [Bdellovibrionales bacterium]|nr:hypothetical protein [Bdellovibrionales bacterium]
MRRLLLLLLLPASGFTAPQLNNVEVHGMIAALCSMLTNHISAVKPHVIFNLHEWSLQENRPGSVRAEGECARPVDPQAPTNKRGQAFRLASTGNVANGEMELFAQFDHAIGKIRFVREGVFDEKSQQLRSEWRLRGVNLVPLGTVDSELVCQIPLLRWVVESLAP